MASVSAPYFLPASSIDPSVPDALYRLDIDQYHRMIEVGVLYSGYPVELLQGLLVEKHRPTPTIHRISVEQYQQMVGAGILTPGDRVELLRGLLVQKMSQNPPHAVAAELTVNALREMLPAGWCVRSEKPISLSDSTPEPDAVVARGAPRDYLRRHPVAADIALIVEVSDATVDQDRRAKRAMYAEAGIANYWIVNLTSRRVEVYTLPRPGDAAGLQAHRKDFNAGDRIPLNLGDQELGAVAVADLLP